MPLYEYLCDACGQHFEAIRKFSDPPLETCAKCGRGPVHKQISSPAFQFKGTGWYITDYAKKDQGGKSSEKGDKGSEKSDAGETSAAKDSTTKTETSTAAPSDSSSKSSDSSSSTAKPPAKD